MPEEIILYWFGRVWRIICYCGIIIHFLVSIYSHFYQHYLHGRTVQKQRIVLVSILLSVSVSLYVYLNDTNLDVIGISEVDSEIILL